MNKIFNFCFNYLYRDLDKDRPYIGKPYINSKGELVKVIQIEYYMGIPNIIILNNNERYY